MTSFDTFRRRPDADRIIPFWRVPTESAEKLGRWQIPMSGRRLSGSTRPGRRLGVSWAYWGQIIGPPRPDEERRNPLV